MELQNYIDNKKNLQNNIIDFLDNEMNIEENYQNLCMFFKKIQISENPYELKLLLHLILKISKDHQRTQYFFTKIEKILLYFKQDISRYFSDYSIFNIFRSNKRILLFFIEEKIITIDQNIVDTMAHPTYKNEKYLHYFYPEIEQFINKELKNQILEELNQLNKDFDIDFEEKRKIGENDNHICKLIREDSIDEFISYFNINNWSINALIEMSIYETNSYLYKINPSLIEYSAFFGSVQIFKYLYKNGAVLSHSVWISAIHGRCPEIFSILEEEIGNPTEIIYNSCLIESIKCHNFKITNYILNNYKEYAQESMPDDFSQSIKSYNYHYFPKDLEDESIFYYLCKFNHSKIVDLLFNSKSICEIDTNKSFTLAANKNNKETIQVLMRHKGIPSYSFCKCDSLSEIAIPSSVKSIGDYSFYKCIQLKQITIPFSVTSIGKEAFSMCSSLKQIIIPSSVVEIGEGAFYGCSSLVRISISSSLTTIKKETFLQCSSLQQILIPSSVKTIEDAAFKGCSSLTQIKIPNSVVEIGENAFRWCLLLQEISIPSSVRSIGIGAFSVCSSLQKVDISSSLESISDYLFSFCPSLEKVIIPFSVKTIGNCAFCECSSLSSVFIPASVTSIGEEAFSGCKVLRNLIIPPSVTDIEKDAFKDCPLPVQITVTSTLNTIKLVDLSSIAKVVTV